MKPHFKRWGWLYGVCAFVVLWPLVLWRLQRIPPLDNATIRKATEELDRQIEREYGPSIWKKYQAFDKKFEEERSLVGNPHFERLSLHYLNVQSSSSIMKEEVVSLREQYGSRFEEWDRLVHEGIANVPFSDMPPMEFDKSQPTWMSNFLMIQTMAKARKAMAMQSLSEADWNSALPELKSNALLSDPIRADFLLGYLIHLACRGIGYSAYNQLLWAEAPVEIQKKALQDLLGLRSTEPRLTPVIRQIEHLYLPTHLAIGSKWSERTTSLIAFFLSVESKIPAANHFQNTRLKSWAARYTRITPNQSLRIQRSIFPAQVKWTTIPSYVRWLSESIEHEPILFEDSIYSKELLDSGDRWTLALINGDWFIRRDWVDAISRGRVAVTRSRLLESAFAARLYRHNRGEWPENLSELIPDYIPSLDSEKEGADETGPYLPLQIAWLDIDDQTRQMLWEENLPMRSIKQLSIESRSDNRQTVLTAYGRSQDWLNQPVIPIAVAQEFRAHPKLVADAKVWMCTDPVAYSGAMAIYPRELIDRLPWKRIDPDHARKITDRYDRMIANDGPSMRNYDLSKIHSASDEEPLEYPRGIRFWAKLRAPEKALVIWSPGPDGVDDGGRIVYDPTNGTISGGDLVVFPEGY